MSMLQCSNTEANMATATKTEASRAHASDSSLVSILTGWTQQGVQTFFSTQRILLDLAMRQNANIMHAVRQQLTDTQHSPTTIFSEVAGEGMSNFIEGQKVLLELGKQQNEILMASVEERMGQWPAAQAMTDLLRRSVDTFIRMQEEFLTIAAKQTHTWLDAAKAGKPYQPEHLLELTKEGMESFVKAQKHFLDVVAEETAKATNGRGSHVPKKVKKAELTQLARHATESFIEAQKKLVDIAGKQMNTNAKAAGKTMDLLRPFPFLPLADLTREGVKSYVDAQKALMDTVVKRTEHHPPARTARRTKKARAKAAAASA
jgi:hypothetical protein